MLFSSLLFLFGFLPLVLVLNLLAPKAWKNGVLIVLSLLFYAWGGPTDTLILLGSILLNHILAIRINSTNSETKRKNWLKIGIAINVSILLAFKYLGFLTQNLNALFEVVSAPISIPHLKIRLPLGISFFTFQQMSMLWDIYQQPTSESRKLRISETALYVSFFPQLIAGPIVRYHDIIAQIKNRKLTVDLFHSGAQRFIIGLFRKVIIANTCGSLADSIIDAPITDVSTSVAWLGIVAYSLQIYFDFSGYSDMAIGIGRMLGFRILENFNFPYISTSIQEFWRRWHISLSSWFRDYVYIPLGGNRKGSVRTYVNLLTVFFLTGMWHGATWSFIFWGLFHGVFLILERVGFKKFLEQIPSPIAWAYTILVVSIGWVFFRIEEFGDAFSYTQVLFGFDGSNINSIYNYLNRETLTVLVLGMVFSTPIPKELITRTMTRLRLGTSFLIWPTEIAKTLIFMLMFGLCVMYENAGSFNPFIYFRF